MPTLSDDEYLALVLRARQPAAPVQQPSQKHGWAARLFWGLLSLVLVVSIALLVVNQVLPGAGAALVGQAMVRLGVPGALTINGTVVATVANAPSPMPLSTPVPVLSPPVSSQPYQQQPQVIQQVVTAVAPPPTAEPPTPAPAGVTLSVSSQGASVSVSNGSAPAVEQEAQPAPGQPGFVQSFVEPPTLAPGNPFVGCLPGRSCTPNSTPWPTSTLPQPGEAGFVESFK